MVFRSRPFGLTLLLALTSPLTVRGQPAQASKPLTLGKPIARELLHGQVHIYEVAATAGDFLHLSIDSSDIVVANIIGPDPAIPQLETTSGTGGAQQIMLLVTQPGNYRVELRPGKSLGAATGRYEILLVERHSATAQDRSRVTANALFRDAMKLYHKRSPEAFRGALEKLQQALTLWRSSGDRLEESRTLDSLAVVHLHLGEVQKALEMIKPAIELVRTRADKRLLSSELTLAGQLYERTGQEQEAVDHLQQALSLRRDLGDRAGEGAVLLGLGTAYLTLGNYEKAREHLEQALKIRRELGEPQGLATALNNLAVFYDHVGDEQRALDLHSEALPLRRAAGDAAGLSSTLNNMANIYAKLGEYAPAIDKLNESLELARKSGDKSREVGTLGNLAATYDKTGEKQKALELYEQTLALRRDLADRQGEAVTLTNLGLLYHSMGDDQKALDSYRRAVELRGASNRRFQALTFNNIGWSQEALGEHRKALDEFMQALRLSRSIANHDTEATALSGIAHVEANMGNLNEARARLAEAIRVTESLRQKVPGPELRASYSSLIHGYYQQYIDILMRSHKHHPSGGFDSAALKASEDGRARSLLDLLSEARTDIRQGVDQKLLERERAAQRRLNELAGREQRLLEGAHTNDQASALDKQVDQATVGYQEIEAELRTRSPRYAALTQPSSPTLAEVQKQLLDEDTVLLEYSLGETRSYLWAVTTRSLSSFELPKAAELEAAAHRLHDLLRTPHATDVSADRVARRKQAGPDLAKSAMELSKLLLDPARDQLKNRRLVIVADGALHYVPFAALPDPSAPRPIQTPLVVGHEIVSLPSVATLAALRREEAGRPQPPKAVAVLGDPVFDRNDPRLSQSGTGESVAVRGDIARAARESGLVSGGGGLVRLAFSRREAEAIVAVSPAGQSMTALDFAASRATLQRPELAQYRIVHFATHGLLNTRHPELSGIVLSLVDEAGQPQDGFIRLNEIYNMNLPVDLVVLSACQSGLGKEVLGEGLVGLVRGFMYAGSVRVVASLWQVDDLATAELMKYFYESMLQKQQRPAAALRAAQIEMRRQKRWRAPYYWAAFALQGEWQ